MVDRDNATETPAHDANIGRVLTQQYRIDSLLGHGGMGSVYRGRQLSIDRAVAIKLIAGDIADNPECIKRFRREAEAMATLQHPNTVRLFDFGIERGELFMVMELLEGRDLSQHLADHGAISSAEAFTILRQVLAALSEAHARGIIHRDLKPANVFMSALPGGQAFAKVMDFGIAGIEADVHTKLTLAGAVLGTPAYMAPEQAQGHAVDARADLYSLGVMLFEMLTGRTPFEADSVVSLLLAQVTKAPPALVDVRSDLTLHPDVQALLDVLLAKAPQDRPSTAAEVIERIERIERQTQEESKRQAPLSSTPSAAPHKSALLAPAPAATSSAPASPFAATLAASLAGGHMQAKFFRAPKLVWVLGLCVVAALLALLLWPETSEQPTVATGPTATPLAEAPKKSDPEPEPADTTRAPPAARDVRPSAPKPASQAPERTASVERKSAAPEPASAAVNESRNDAKPFPHIRNTLDKVFGSASGVSQADRRNALLQRGPTYNNVRAAKAAYRAGNLSSQAYEDTIWVLKTKRARQIDTEKRNYRAGHITRDEYKRRVTRIDREYEGS